MPCRPAPVTGPERGRRWSGRRRRKCGGTASSLLARTPKGSRNPARSVMISRVLAADLPKHVGEHVMIAGWLHRRRELKSVTFLVIRDPSAPGQGVPPAGAPPLPEETVIQ